MTLHLKFKDGAPREVVGEANRRYHAIYQLMLEHSVILDVGETARVRPDIEMANELKGHGRWFLQNADYFDDPDATRASAMLVIEIADEQLDWLAGADEPELLH